MKSKFFILIAFIFYAAILIAQIPDGYYNNAIGKKDAALKTALHLIIHDHTKLGYYVSASYFLTTDWNPNGYLWDMYGETRQTSWNGNILNREHNLPKSWFGVSGGNEESHPMGTDLHNLYPSEKAANSAKSNYPLGEVNASPTFNNGVSKVGKSKIASYSATVFEPADQYKGDFARDYLYMVTCYENEYSRWTSTGTQSMLQNDTYPTLKPYAIDLLLKWHSNDPVSEKETNRNNEVYKIQHNRNPFVDFPVLAQYIWGDKKGTAWGGNDQPDKDFYLSYDNAEKTIFVPLREPENTDYVIYSILGIMIKAGKFNSESFVDVSYLTSGMYIVLVYSKNNRYAEKILVN
ncbi:MAG: endonuclease [Paludibacter sp.]|jgi:endonuclease I|nr:endonuclease [Paludibacter sp.]